MFGLKRFKKLKSKVLIQKQRCFWWLGLLAMFAVLLGKLPAVSAHHVVSELGIAWVKPVSLMEFSSEVTGFKVGGLKGQYVSLVPRVEYAFHRYFSLAMRLPMHMMFADQGNNGAGFGDLSVSGKARLFASKEGGLVVSGGMGVEFPTGDEGRGLGNGHFEFGPFVTFSSRPVDHFVMVGLLAGRFSMDEHGHGSDGDISHDDPDHDHSTHDHSMLGGADDSHGTSVISIHGNEELMARLGLGYAGDRFYALGGMQMAFKLQKKNILGPLIARMEGGFFPQKKIRVALGAEIPFAGENRFDWRVRLGLAKLF